MEMPGTDLRAHQLFWISTNHYTGRTENDKRRMKNTRFSGKKIISLTIVAYAILLIAEEQLVSGYLMESQITRKRYLRLLISTLLFDCITLCDLI
jgi:hypothetical protein